MNDSVRLFRRRIFKERWPLDDEITAISADVPSHAFLHNPAGQYSYIYLTQFVKAFAERQLRRPFNSMAVLDWGCGKGHVSKLINDMGPGRLDSCDRLLEEEDSTFGQSTPIVERFDISVLPLDHDYILPYESDVFDIVLSVGVLEHVPYDRDSLAELNRVLKSGGLFFCFFLPTKYSWTQKVAHSRGNSYHDRLYNERQVRGLLETTGFELIDIWYRQILPKNTVHYPNFRMFELLDQFVTENTPLRYFATNLEFVCAKQSSNTM